MGRGSGGVLLSRRAAPQVSWELEGLTTVFEMGTGVTLPLESPIPLPIRRESKHAWVMWHPLVRCTQQGDHKEKMKRLCCQRRHLDICAGGAAASYCPGGLPLKYRGSWKA